MENFEAIINNECNKWLSTAGATNVVAMNIFLLCINNCVLMDIPISKGIFYDMHYGFEFVDSL